MVGAAAERSPDSPAAGADDCLSQLRTLTASQILEVLAGGFCSDCQSLLKTRVQSLVSKKDAKSSDNSSEEEFRSPLTSFGPSSEMRILSSKSSSSWSSGSPYAVRQNGKASYLSPASVNSKESSRLRISDPKTPRIGGETNELSEEQEEWVRCSQVRKKDFVHFEKIQGKEIDILKGLELHAGVFNAEEQKKIVEHVYHLQSIGRKGQLKARTYSEPRKWMRGKGRVTLQFGCCYNYAVDKDGNPPGIIRDEDVDPLPPLFKWMIKRMVRWHVLPPSCVPNSCIVNIYDEGDCIPPHIDHHDFVRPFCTVSFLSECNILFGSNLKIIGPGEFSGSYSIPLPVGSVMILNGNGADVAKHCVPAVPAKRISVTFRKMDDSKLPYKFSPDPELLNIKPLVKPGVQLKSNPRNVNGHGNLAIPREVARNNLAMPREVARNSYALSTDDFPPLGGLSLSK